MMQPVSREVNGFTWSEREPDLGGSFPASLTSEKDDQAAVAPFDADRERTEQQHRPAKRAFARVGRVQRGPGDVGD